jgi:hypothetical protein
MEGAKGVESSVTRYVARLLRHAPQQPRTAQPAHGKPPQPPAAVLVLSVREDGRELKGSVVARTAAEKLIQQRQQRQGTGGSAAAVAC